MLADTSFSIPIRQELYSALLEQVGSVVSLQTHVPPLSVRIEAYEDLDCGLAR
jgi:hypothetical protein